MGALYRHRSVQSRRDAGEHGRQHGSPIEALMKPRACWRGRRPAAPPRRPRAGDGRRRRSPKIPATQTLVDGFHEHVDRQRSSNNVRGSRHPRLSALWPESSSVTTLFAAPAHPEAPWSASRSDLRLLNQFRTEFQLTPVGDAPLCTSPPSTGRSVLTLPVPSSAIVASDVTCTKAAAIQRYGDLAQLIGQRDDSGRSGHQSRA
jgi:hypothetical protein